MLIDKESEAWNPERQAIIDQPSLLFPGKRGLEKIPYRFRYRYRCTAPRCRGHEQSIIDWEIAEAYRKWQHSYGEADTLRRIRDHWVDDLCGPDRDTYFYVGNQHQAPGSFLVLGVFWPPKA